MNQVDVRKNGFDIIRYWSAISVMFLHYTAYALRLSDNTDRAMYIIRNVVSFFHGVVILFSMSGFLVAGSFERSKNRKEFIVKRVVRLYPELWLCTLVNLVVVCSLVKSSLNKGIFTWLLTQVIGIAYTPTCLTNFATGSVNGALWTIFTEI